MQAGWLISVSCTLYFPLQLQFPSLLRSRSGRSHAMLPRPHAGEHCVTPVRAPAKETNSSPVQPKLLFVCKMSIVLFCFLFSSLVSIYCFVLRDICFLYSIFVFHSLISAFYFLRSVFGFLFFRFLYTSHRQLAKSTQSNLDPPSLVRFCTHSLLSARVLCLAGLRDSDKSFQSIWKDGRRFTIVM